MAGIIKIGRAKKAVFAVVAMALAFTLLNLAAFAVEWLPYGTSMEMDSPVGLYVEARLGTRPQLRPGARIRGLLYNISINSLGFRGPELVTPRPGNSLRVWCVGGSSTFDIYSSDNGATWPAQLQGLLQRALPRRAVEVINAGIPGEVLHGSLIDFVRHYPAVRPDVLVVYHGPNDLRGVANAPPPRLPGELVRRLSWLAFFRVIQREAEQRMIPRGSYTGRRLSEGQLDRVAHELRPIVMAAEQRGVAVVLASHALRLSLAPTVSEAEASLGHDSDLLVIPPLEVSRAMDAYNAIVERIALERDHTFADVRRAVPPDDKYWGDSTHFTAAGSRLAARAVAGAVLKAMGSGR